MRGVYGEPKPVSAQQRALAVAGFTEDGTRALEASPEYFLKWYTAKSILLVAVCTSLAYQFGKQAKKK